MNEQDRRGQDRTPCHNRLTEVSITNEYINRPVDNPPEIIQVQLYNISATGACIISVKPFELDQLVKFHDPLINKSGRVSWTCQSRKECKAGIQFI